MCGLESDDRVRNARELSDLRASARDGNFILPYLCNNACGVVALFHYLIQASD